MDDIQKQIEQYVLGTLEGRALTDFEQLMSSDPALANRVNLEKALHQAIRLAPQVAQFREQLKATDAQLAKPLQTKSFRMRQLAAIAAVALLFIAAWWFFNQPEPIGRADLFAAHFHPSEAYNQVARGATGGGDTTAFKRGWDAAEFDLKAEQYEAAIRKFDQLLSLPEARDYYDDLFYARGLACLQTGRSKEAIASFEAIKTSFPTEKPWYLALAHFQAGDDSTARKILEQIKNSESPFKKDAKELLDGF